jgi:hypothetical protein
MSRGRLLARSFLLFAEFALWPGAAHGRLGYQVLDFNYSPADRGWRLLYFCYRPFPDVITLIDIFGCEP